MTLIEFAKTFIDRFIYMELPFECQGMVMRIISTETVFINHGRPGDFHMHHQADPYRFPLSIMIMFPQMKRCGISK